MGVLGLRFRTVSISTGPTISGTPEVGQTVSVSGGIAYQWYQSVTSNNIPISNGNENYIGVPIVGATSSTYLLVNDDADEFVFCDVTAINNSIRSSNYVGIIA